MGDEELVHQAGVDELGVEARAALAQHRADAALAAQVGERLGEVDGPVVADDPDVVTVSGGSASEAVKISTRPPPSLNRARPRAGPAGR